MFEQLSLEKFWRINSFENSNIEWSSRQFGMIYVKTHITELPMHNVSKQPWKFWNFHDVIRAISDPSPDKINLFVQTH